MLNWRLENVVPPQITGNPGVIDQFARRYDRMADALFEAVGELQALANEGVSISLAVDQVRERAEESIDTTRKVAVRYRGAAQTLDRYQDELQDAIQTGSGARYTIESNNPTAGYWRRRERDLRNDLRHDPTNNTIVEDLQEASQHVNDYDDAYYRAITSYNGAVEAKDRAVTRAIGGLNDAADRADLNDAWYEVVEGVFDVLYDLAQKYLAPIIEILRDVLEIIKKIVDILALIVTILAIFIPVLAPFAAALTAISLILAAAILLCSLVLFALGKETLGRVIGDIIDLAVGVITAKMGGIKFGSIVGDVVSATSTIAQTGGRILLSEAVIVTKFAIPVAGEFIEAIVVDQIKEISVGVVGDLVTFGIDALAGDMMISDMPLLPGPNGTLLPNPVFEQRPWGDPGISNFDGATTDFGENLLDTLTLGTFDAAGYITDRMDSVGSGIDDAAMNLVAITAVPAG